MTKKDQQKSSSSCTPPKKRGIVLRPGPELDEISRLSYSEKLKQKIVALKTGARAGH